VTSYESDFDAQVPLLAYVPSAIAGNKWELWGYDGPQRTASIAFPRIIILSSHIESGAQPVSGRGATASWWQRSKGVNNSADVYDAKNCKEVPGSDDCLVDCVLKKFEDPLPDYAVGPHGTDCQEWVDDVLDSCREECEKAKRKKK
jgi:hypothetical protein